MQHLNPVALMKETISEWQRDKASRLAAALAYYTAFSIAPLLLLMITVAGMVLGDKAAQGVIFEQLEGLLGPEVAGFFQATVAHSRDSGANTISAVVGVATLAWSASNVFAQLQDALDTIWEVQPRPAGIVGAVKRRAVPLSMVLGIGFILLVSLLLSAGLSAIGTLLGTDLPGSDLLWQIVNEIISIGIITLLFAAIFKVLPDAEIRWGDVWFGALATSVLFVIGKAAIGLYLGHASIGSTYGAAGSLLVFLVWVYYSAQILFFGAELTQVYARARGSQIVPSTGAERLTAATRAEQGIPNQRNGAAATAAAVAGSTAGGTYAPSQHDPGAIKKLLWTGISAASIALTGLLAERLTTGLWRGVTHEPPPKD